jgi:hypothetical protein
MQANRKITMAITLIAALLMAMLTTSSALASEGTEIEVVGTVFGINLEDGTLEIKVEVEPDIFEIFTVQVGDNFNFETIGLGDTLEVKGTLGADGILVCTELKIQERARDKVQLQDGEGNASFCVSQDKLHPVVEKISVTYGVPYETILGYICGENSVGLGQIMLTLQTAELTKGSFEEILNGGFENISWGQIWQENNLIGKPDKGVPPGQIKKQDGEGDPEKKIPPGQEKKQGDGSELDKLFEDLVPKNWFKKGKK